MTDNCATVSFEEFNEKYTSEAIVRKATQAEDESYTCSIASSVKHLCFLFAVNHSEIKFRLLESIVGILNWFGAECRLHGLCGVANPDVWGNEMDWLLQARIGLNQVLANRQVVKVEYRAMAIQLADLLFVLFGEEWASKDDKEGKFVQLLVAMSQIELECALDSIMRRGVSSDEEELLPKCSKSVEKTNVSAEDEVDITCSCPSSFILSSDRPFSPLCSFHQKALTAACTLLQHCVGFLVGGGEEVNKNSENCFSLSWDKLDPVVVDRLHELLVSAYSVLLKYFQFRQGIVIWDVDIVSVGLLETLMCEFDSTVFATDAQKVHVFLQDSGYIEQGTSWRNDDGDQQQPEEEDDDDQ